MEQGIRPLAAREIAPEAAPTLRVVADAARGGGGDRLVRLHARGVKPSGLTGGKGVKVMGPHLASHDEARDYAPSLLARAQAEGSVLIEEKIVGAEFTIQAISDGRPSYSLQPPTTTLPLRRRPGPGTGGMGSLSMAELDAAVHDHAPLPAGLLDHQAGRSSRLAQQGRHFTGIMNSGFFATAAGVKVIEFNARFGDPECMNIMSLFAGNWPEVMQRISNGE